MEQKLQCTVAKRGHAASATRPSLALFLLSKRGVLVRLHVLNEKLGLLSEARSLAVSGVGLSLSRSRRSFLYKLFRTCQSPLRTSAPLVPCHLKRLRSPPLLQ